jgi:hypothetical protein
VSSPTDPNNLVGRAPSGTKGYLASAKFAGNIEMGPGNTAGAGALPTGAIHRGQAYRLNFSHLGAPRSHLNAFDRNKSAHTY